MRPMIMALGSVLALALGCTAAAGNATVATSSFDGPTAGVLTMARPDPSTSPAQPASSGATGLPAVTAPRYPAQARVHTPEGAVAFTGYFYALFDWGYATNDPGALDGAVLASCGGCARYKQSLAGVLARGGTLHGGRVHVRSYSFEPKAFATSGDFAVTVALDEQAATVTFPSSAPATVSRVIRGHRSTVVLRWVGRWRVAEVRSA
jgi:hypothetical protein